MLVNELQMTYESVLGIGQRGFESSDHLKCLILCIPIDLIYAAYVTHWALESVFHSTPFKK